MRATASRYGDGRRRRIRREIRDRIAGRSGCGTWSQRKSTASVIRGKTTPAPRKAFCAADPCRLGRKPVCGDSVGATINGHTQRLVLPANLCVPDSVDRLDALWHRSRTTMDGASVSVLRRDLLSQRAEKPKEGPCHCSRRFAALRAMPCRDHRLGCITKRRRSPSSVE